MAHFLFLKYFYLSRSEKLYQYVAYHPLYSSFSHILTLKPHCTFEPHLPPVRQNVHTWCYTNQMIVLKIPPIKKVKNLFLRLGLVSNKVCVMSQFWLIPLRWGWNLSSPPVSDHLVIVIKKFTKFPVSKPQSVKKRNYKEFNVESSWQKSTRAE